MVSQLRIYTINKGKLEEFVKAWSTGVYPLRLKHGFSIEGAWTIKERNEFVWILTYDGPESWEAKDNAYYSSPERRAMASDPAQYIAKIEHWFISPVKIG